MGNMIEYLKWRGDLGFDSAPFNEIDNLILSCISYVEFDNIVPCIGDGEITVYDASEKFFNMYTQEDLDKNKSFVRLMYLLLKAMAESNRYKDAILSDYVNILDPENELQFCALKIRISDDTTFISYRGTDDSIIGWKEDFNICWQTIPAAAKAVQYLNLVEQQRVSKLRIGGHSKGGHLAIHASTYCSPDIQDRIIDIFDNDGPGHLKMFFDFEGYIAIKDKIHRFSPETSIIGSLLKNDIPFVVIKSSANGLFEHDALTWECMQTSLVRGDDIANASKVFKSSFDDWILELPIEDRKPYIDNLFSILEAPGCKTLTELQNSGIKGFTTMLTATETLKDKKTRAITTKLLRLLYSNTLTLESNKITQLLNRGNS